MLKSLEDYLIGLSFEPPEAQADQRELDAGERAFVEKYLGQDTLEQMEIQNPEPVPLPVLQPAEAAPQSAWELKPEIIVAPPTLQVAPAAKTEIIVVPEKAPQKVELTVATPEAAAPAPEIALAEPEQAAAAAVIEAPLEVAAPAEVVEETVTRTEARVETASAEKVATAEIQETASAEKVAGADTQETALAAAEGQVAPAAPEISEREKLRLADQIQVVSFFVSGQLFLLPVAGIQEVLRHMELVKVPQAPDFIAGAINLRGSVMPLIHLSALLTNSTSWTYDERSFIIVTGAEGMQMGLIIDKVSSMHMIPQQKIIWNVESKLGDAGEFLSALVDLDDKVCGMIAPDIIKQKLFAEF